MLESPWHEGAAPPGGNRGGWGCALKLNFRGNPLERAAPGGQGLDAQFNCASFPNHSRQLRGGMTAGEPEWWGHAQKLNFRGNPGGQAGFGRQREYPRNSIAHPALTTSAGSAEAVSAVRWGVVGARGPRAAGRGETQP
jgi:hypothetical protein